MYKVGQKVRVRTLASFKADPGITVSNHIIAGHDDLLLSSMLETVGKEVTILRRLTIQNESSAYSIAENVWLYRPWMFEQTLKNKLMEELS